MFEVPLDHWKMEEESANKNGFGGAHGGTKLDSLEALSNSSLPQSSGFPR